MLLSVIIPVYNLENYIEECVRSVCNQTYKQLEIIIVDDGSSDGSLDICQKLAREDDRIIVVTQKNAGVTMARKKGLSLATGEYVTFVDGDDYLDPEMYRCMMEHAEDNDLMVCGIFYHISSSNARVKEGYDGFEGKYCTKEQLHEVWGRMLYNFNKRKATEVSPSVCNKIFKRDLAQSVIEKISPDIFYGEDAVFVYQYILNCHSLYFLKMPFYHYRYRDGSACHSKNERMLENINRLYIELKKVFEQHEEKAALLKQFERLMVIWSIDALNKFMGFSMESRIPKFLIDIEEFRNVRLALYGAGRMGQDVMSHLLNEGISPIAWLDKDYEHFRANGLEVDSPELLVSLNFDVLLISVSEEDLANKIKKDIIGKGVSEEKILWKKPIKVY